MQIEATDVTKRYGAVTALDGLTLSIPSGSTFGLLGTNGAGKTTLFRLLIGHDRPDEGTVRIGDTDVAAAGPRIRERVGYLPEQVGFPPELTAREVLAVNARVRGLDAAAERVDEVLETVRLTDDADRPVEGFSNGMGRRLGLATALLPEPDVLLLDEPTAGLDPLGVADFHRIVRGVSDRTNATVLVCSHALAEVERLCDRAAVLTDGRLVATGAIDELAPGSDGTREVHVRVQDPDLRSRLADRCGEYGAVDVAGGSLVVTVDGDDVLALLDDLDGRVDLADVEVRGPGLEDAFQSLVSPDGSRTDVESAADPDRPTDKPAARAGGSP